MFGNTRTKDMTQGSPLKLLISFTLPLLFGNAFQQLYSIVDTAVVGRGVSTEALAAVGATGSINWLVLGFVTGFTHGFAIAVSQAFGSKDEKLTRKTVIMSFYLSAIISVAVSVVSIIFARDILKLMGTPENLIPGGALYISIIFGGSVFMILYNVAAAVLRAFGNSTVPLMIIVFASIFNVVADIVFVVVFRWGIAGVAIATVMANTICVPVCIHYIRKIPVLKFTKEDFRWDSKVAKRLISLGLPVGLMNSVTAIGNVALQFVVNSMGEGIVAAYAVGHKIFGLADHAANVIGMALGTYVGQNIGAGNIPRTKRGVRTAFWLSNAFTAFLAAIMIFFGKNLTALFVGPEEIGVINDAYPYIAITGAMMWVLGLLFVYRSSLQSLGDTIVPMFSGLLELVLRLSIVFLLPASLGFYRVGIAEVSAWFGAAVMLCIGYYVRMAKIQKSPELLKKLLK